jgi:asparagine synthetase B (glutamine-hydrolysing)
MGRIGFDIMCGISGFSLAYGSKINARKLAHALLCEIESRGNQASGVAWQSVDASGTFKGAVRGSQLSLRGLPKRASSVILHTRYATHGSIDVAENNHPVASPDGRIALVHNGVIYNHELVRKQFSFKLPEVDTSVIPAILQKFGSDRFDMLDGDAAVAWLDESDRGVLRVGRVSHSPLVVAQLADGSFVFASTEVLLRDALKRVGLKPVWFEVAPEYRLYTVRLGRVDSVSELPSTSADFVQPVSSYSYGKYRGMTSGGKRSSGYWYDDAQSGVLGYSPVEEELEEDFELFLTRFVEHDGMFYDFSGVPVGTLDVLREEFEDYRYNEYWATKEYGYNPYSFTEGSFDPERFEGSFDEWAGFR